MYDSSLMPGKRKRCSQPRCVKRTMARLLPDRFSYPPALLFFLLLLQNTFAQDLSIFPLNKIRAGQRGIGKTVFSGSQVEEFQVEILGILRDSGPKQSIILARLSGGPLAQTGVMQGMSGSPVYIEGRLAGAIALAFPFSKEPIAGVRPIEEMLAAGGPAVRQSARVAPPNSQSALANISTPLAFHGFTENAVEHFLPELRKLGLEPRQGISSGASLSPEMGDPSQLRPGEMISVQLLSGDMNIGADGTLTAIQGNRVYAFGHQFLASGTTELQIGRAHV